MKLTKLFLLGLAGLFFGCQQAELAEPEDMVAVNMKTVTISAGIDGVDTKASLDSQTGAFTWQSGDLISVLATDGKFYDFILEGEYGVKTAEFVGKIPETAAVTTVATYPRIVANGTDNTVLTGNTLNYVLPATWNYAKDVSNVPMVATFGEGADHMSFKQVGGVMRFPVKNLPAEATFVVTMHDKTITGEFPVDIATLGESCMTAGTAASELVINYTSDADGQDAEFNVPVPTGVYNNFTVTIKDAEGNELFTKKYSAENKVNRATLLNMKELVLPERPMVISEVWPFFVDARVVFANYAADAFAFYIDGSETPVIVEAEEIMTGKMGALIGGNFAHNTPHTVAVAKVVDGDPVPASMSNVVEFTTGSVMQMTYNTGTKFICAAWDDVAIGKENSTVYDEATGKWSMVAHNSAVNGRNIRGYRVQLYADDKETLLYDEVPFSGQVDYGGAISNSSWIGKIGGQNVLLPTALTFGWLEPGTKYYFRVQTLAEPVVFDSPENGYFKPSEEAITVSSTRGGCAWSDFVEMSTDMPHVASANEVLYEGFDDMMFNGDMMNMASAVVPEFLTKATKDSDYKSTKSASLYQSWVEKPFAERKFSEQGFNTMLGVYYHGLTDDKNTVKNKPSYLNKYAGSLEGWSVVIGSDNKPTRTMNPNFGSVRLGESGGASGKVSLRTAPIMSDKLSETVPTKCIIKVKVSAHATDKERVNAVLGIYHYRDGQALDEKNTTQFNLDENGAISQDWAENYTWTDNKNYIHYPTWFEVETEYNLLKGDIIGFEKSNPKVDGISDYYKGCVTIGEITIEVAPQEPTPFEDNGVGTEPDNTDYDIFGLGEFPISFWWTVPTVAHNYDPDKTLQYYRDMADAGINVVNYVGELDLSVEENKRIMDVCTQLDMKFLGNVWAPTNEARIAAIKEHLASSPTYVGEHLVDEPGIHEFDGLAAFVDAYNAELPDEEVYINLFPKYANAATQLGTDYEDYINQYLTKVKTKSLSYDYYGLHKDGGIFTDFYSNLDLVRSKTLDKRMPFWVITQSGIAGSARMPEEKEQRWSVWANIAVGSKGISYFCYWTPSAAHGEYDDNGFMVAIDGTKNPMYDWVKQINSDINTIGKKLLPCHADGAILTAATYYPLYDNNGAGRTKYGPIQSVSGNTSVLCGCFRDARISENGDNYKGYKALVMSQMPNRDVNAYLNMDPSVTQITVTHNNTTQTLQVSNTLNATVGSVTVSYDGAKLTLGIPSGEAALLEF